MIAELLPMSPSTSLRQTRHNAPILLVEDDVSLQRSLSEFLKDSGYQTYAVRTMGEAREAISAIAPGVCLLDLNLPDGSGLDLLRQIVERNLPVRVVVMTAFPLHHLRPNYPSSTLVDWLTKPVPPNVLLTAVQQAMVEQTAP
jgi:two-component system repressor protein LuxO